MGIKGLNQLLKRICDSAHVTLLPISQFAGKKIAIDATLYVCMFKMRNNYVESIIDFLTTLRQNDIHPFFVFDGIAPEEKKKERLERIGKRAAAHNRIKSLERDLEIYKNTGELSDILKNIDFKDKTRRLAPAKISVSRIQEYIDKLKSQILNLSPQDFDTMKSLLECFNIPFTTANSEGEFLCAALARRGLVDAVMSSDTDTLACLAPRVINRIDGDYFHIVTLETILLLLKLNESEFVDLCIMCGTDFNNNIPKIGPVRSYELLLKYRSIDALDLKMDISILHHKRVREIFRYSSEDLPDNVPLCGSIQFDKLSGWTKNVEAIKNRLKN